MLDVNVNYRIKRGKDTEGKDTFEIDDNTTGRDQREVVWQHR